MRSVNHQDAVAIDNHTSLPVRKGTSPISICGVLLGVIPILVGRGRGDGNRLPDGRCFVLLGVFGGHCVVIHRDRRFCTFRSSHTGVVKENARREERRMCTSSSPSSSSSLALVITATQHPSLQPVFTHPIREKLPNHIAAGTPYQR